VDDASDHFWRTFSKTGTITATCDCGHTYFCVYNNEGDYDEGELETLRAKMAAEPKRLTELSCSHVSVMQLGGNQYVEGCDCGRLKKYEDFIWHWRREITEYIAARVDDELATLGYVHERLARAQFRLKSHENASVEEG